MESYLQFQINIKKKNPPISTKVAVCLQITFNIRSVSALFNTMYKIKRMIQTFPISCLLFPAKDVIVMGMFLLTLFIFFFFITSFFFIFFSQDFSEMAR